MEAFMLEQSVFMFDNMKPMLKKLKKKSYEQNMKEFKHQYGICIDDMLVYIEKQEDKQKAAKEISMEFCEKVKERLSVNGKIRGVVQMDMNMFAIYYIFPAILSSYRDNTKLFADTLCETWGSVFKDSKIGYTDYDTIYNSFSEKIFGII